MAIPLGANRIWDHSLFLTFPFYTVVFNLGNFIYLFIFHLKSFVFGQTEKTKTNFLLQRNLFLSLNVTFSKQSSMSLGPEIARP